MRKGQMEIIGFVVIILLLFFGMLIYFQLSSKDSTDLLAEAEENLEVSNLLTSIKFYTVCEGTSMGDAIKTCVEGGFECEKEACLLVEEEVPILISIWGWEEEQYMFEIEEKLALSDCKGNSFIDDYNPVGTTVRLKYCY